MSASEILKTVRQGEELAIDMLRFVVQRASFDVTQATFFFVHHTSMSRELQEMARDGLKGRNWNGWSPVPWYRPDCRGDSSWQAALFRQIPLDAVPVILCVADKCSPMYVPPTSLLPPSEFGELVTDANGEEVASLRQFLWMAYSTDAADGSKPHLQRFQEAVRAAVAVELAKPGPKRPLIDILFEVAGGAKLEARGRAGHPLTWQDLRAALEVPMAG